MTTKRKTYGSCVSFRVDGYFWWLNADPGCKGVDQKLSLLGLRSKAYARMEVVPT